MRIENFSVILKHRDIVVFFYIFDIWLFFELKIFDSEGLFKTSRIKKNSKELMDHILKKNPFLKASWNKKGSIG